MRARAPQPTVECPRCGRCYEDWTLAALDVDLDPQVADPGYLQAAARAVCPHCGAGACVGGVGEPDCCRPR